MGAFTGKRVVVTGAGRDFGRALSILLAQEGAEVLLSARSLDAASATASEIKAAGGAAAAFACDLAAPSDVAAFADAIVGQGAAIDVLIHSAARWLVGPLPDVESEADAADVIASGLTGPMQLTGRLLPALRRSSAADIVFILSACAETGYVGSVAHPAFYAAKHGLAGFCDVLAARLAAEEIRVTGIYPPDFANVDPLSDAWFAPRPAGGLLGSQGVWNAVRFALVQPRDVKVARIGFNGPTRLSLGL